MKEKGHESSRLGSGQQDHDYRPAMDDFVRWLAEIRLSLGFSTCLRSIFDLVVIFLPEPVWAMVVGFQNDEINCFVYLSTEKE